MVKVKLLVGRVAINGDNNSPGDIIEVSDREALALVESQQAEEVKQTPKRKSTKKTDGESN
jgi:ribosomal 50S subunit-recycling heat shock protein